MKDKNFYIKVSKKIEKNKYVQSVRDGLMISMPLLIVGSFFLILRFLPVPGYLEFMQKIFGEKWINYIIYPIDTSFGLMALFALLGISYRFSEEKQVEKLPSIILSVYSFIMLTPYVIFFKKESILGIKMEYLGSNGIFLAIIIPFIVINIYAYFIKRNFVLKMPKSVPNIVQISFSSLIPFFVITFMLLIIRILLENSKFENIHKVISIFLTKPLLNIGNTYIGLVFVVLTLLFFTSLGLHGTSIVMGIASPVYNSMMDQNRIAFQSGKFIPNILTPQFFDLFIGMGGVGNTIGLVILMLFFSKSKQFKNLGKLSIIPAIFNINEPILFGVPIVMNPILVIPFFISSFVTTTTGYFLLKFNFIERLTCVVVPWTTPPIINAYLATNGGIKMVIFQILAIFFSIIIYYPFFKKYDNIKLEEEKI